jgi:hypothetical protein
MMLAQSKKHLTPLKGKLPTKKHIKKRRVSE